MEYFAGSDLSMEETRVCVLDSEGAVVHEVKAASTPEAIVDELTKAPNCQRIVFEAGRTAPMLEYKIGKSLPFTFRRWTRFSPLDLVGSSGGHRQNNSIRRRISCKTSRE